MPFKEKSFVLIRFSFYCVSYASFCFVKVIVHTERSCMGNRWRQRSFAKHSCAGHQVTLLRRPHIEPCFSDSSWNLPAVHLRIRRHLWFGKFEHEISKQFSNQWLLTFGNCFAFHCSVPQPRVTMLELRMFRRRKQNISSYERDLKKEEPMTQQ